jgi:hypothetical protein
MTQSIAGGVAALALLLAAPAHAGDMPFADAKAQAVSQGKPLLIDFYATW